MLMLGVPVSLLGTGAFMVRRAVKLGMSPRILIAQLRRVALVGQASRPCLSGRFADSQSRPRSHPRRRIGRQVVDHVVDGLLDGALPASPNSSLMRAVSHRRR